jgi:hypothetical protein
MKMGYMMKKLSLLLVSFFVLTACSEGVVRKDSSYFRINIDEAKAVFGECKLNGTRGMSDEKKSECDAAKLALRQ